MNKKRYLLLLIVDLSLITIGGFIYILFRTESLLLFSWIKSLSLYPFVNELRYLSQPYCKYVPVCIIYSLPNALWLLSGLISFYLIWDEKSKGYYFWIIFFIFISIGLEVGQGLKLIAGNYDNLDLFFLIFTVILFFLITYRAKGKSNEKV